MPFQCPQMPSNNNSVFLLGFVTCLVSIGLIHQTFHRQQFSKSFKVSKYFNSKKVHLAMMDFCVQPHVQQFARLTTCFAPLDLITMAVRCLKLVYPSMVILILWKSSSIKFLNHLFFQTKHRSNWG